MSPSDAQRTPFRPEARRLASHLAALLEDLCATQSVTGNEAEICEGVAEWFRPLAFHVERVGNALAAWDSARERPRVLLCGHLDTVPPTGPFPEPRQDGDRITGLGASDMKAGLAVMLGLAAGLPARTLPVSVGFAFYDREEGPYEENGLEPLLDACPALAGAAFGVLLEPSDNGVQVGCLGSIQARVVIPGRRAHSARPWEGVNAIHSAAPLLAALSARRPQVAVAHGLRFPETLSATTASGGIARNVVPDAFALNLNYRFAPGRDLVAAEAELRSFVAAHAPTATVEVVDRSPAGAVVLDHPMAIRLVEESGQAVLPKWGWTDVARLTARRIPAVNFGPGSPSESHQAGEGASVSAMVAGFRILWRVLGGG
ncbi:MAG: succinyl-diaminopimelate desuccinylase [Deltaproteobacteria bacterium]|nr:succinyl-diaminopimelate desuccinylase [Deltaproteobacteria bacterium]